MRKATSFLICAVLFFLVSCDGNVFWKKKDLLSQIRARGELIVLTTNEPTTYYFDRDNNPAGPEYEMAQSFAEGIGVGVRYRVYSSVQEIIQALRDGEGHIAAAGITVTEDRQAEFDFGEVYQTVSEQLVCHRNGKYFDETDDLLDVDIVVPASSSYIDTLTGYLEDYSDLVWQVDEHLLPPQLMEKVWQGEIECTVCDSTVVDINRRYFPELSVKYTLVEDSRLAWMFKKKNEALRNAITEWFASFKESGEFALMQEKYYGYIEVFDYVDVRAFRRRIEKRYLKYRDMFAAAAEANGLPESLLAALSYQESHWNPRARSPTGVRGMMMLTLPVAKSYGITNRLDPESNIHAGAKHFRRMKERIGNDIPEPNRTWLALAAYNVGLGHFRDAQALAVRQGKNPDCWVDLKEVLPLLSQKEYYSTLRYGYARGNEPVRYVSRVRDYRDMFEQFVDGIEGTLNN